MATAFMRAAQSPGRAAPSAWRQMDRVRASVAGSSRHSIKRVALHPRQRVAIVAARRRARCDQFALRQTVLVPAIKQRHELLQREPERPDALLQPLVNRRAMWFSDEQPSGGVLAGTIDPR